MTADSAPLGFLLAGVCERFVNGVLAVAQSSGHVDMSASQGLAVLVISYGGDSVTTLAARLGMTTQAASKVADGLESAGLLRREADPADARRRRLVLTESGAGLAERLEAGGAAEERRWESLIGADALDAVRGALAAYLSDSPGDARPAQRRVRFS